MALADPIFSLVVGFQLFWAAFDMTMTGVQAYTLLILLVYGIWNMVCGIWYENGIHSVFAYVSRASHSGCLQCSASIPCFISDENSTP